MTTPPTSPVSSAIQSINGVSIAYAMGLVNSAMALIFAFGVHLTSDQQSTVTAFINAGLVMIAHVSHSSAKHTKPVIPAPPIDESHLQPPPESQP